MKSLSRVRPSATPWTAVHQAPPALGVSRQEYWSGVPLPSATLGIYHVQKRQIYRDRETPILWPPDVKSWLIWKDPDAGKDLRAGGEGDNRGWDGWMASPTQWTWVWVDSGSWWWTGKPGMLWFMGSQRVGHDWATELNWQRQKVDSCLRRAVGGKSEEEWLLMSTRLFGELLKIWSRLHNSMDMLKTIELYILCMWFVLNVNYILVAIILKRYI